MRKLAVAQNNTQVKILVPFLNLFASLLTKKLQLQLVPNLFLPYLFSELLKLSSNMTLLNAPGKIEHFQLT